jgi:predicted MFS family arabinose efflux permease
MNEIVAADAVGTDVLPADARPSGRFGRLPLAKPLAQRDFRLLWAGESVSLLGDQFHFVALAWLVLSVTGSGLALGTVFIASSIPRAALMLLGGALSDRMAPRTLMLASNLLRAAVVAVLTVVVVSGRAELWHLVVLGVVFGSVDAIFIPAMNTIVPMLVPTDRLPAANALVQGTAQFAGLIGPAIAGIVVAVVGTGPAFAIDALSFAFAALMVAAIRGGRRSGPGQAPEAAATDGAERPSLLATIRAGAAYAFADPAIRLVIVLTAAFNLAFTGPISVGLAWLASNRFEGGSIAFGFMFAGFGAGALVGAILAGSLPPLRHQGAVLLSVAGSLGIALAAVGVAPSAAVATLMLIPMGLGIGYINVIAIAWLQGRTDPAMIGRVMSLVTLGSVALAPLSLALAGALVDTAATAMFAAAGALVLVVAAAGLLTGAYRRLDRSNPEGD